MTHAELAWRIVPLFIVTISLCFVEFRTGLIPDKIVYPAALYFVVTGCLLGHKPWWHYPLGLIALLLLFAVIGAVYHHITGKQCIGGGAIKL